MNDEGALRPLNGEELLSIFSRREPTKLQLAETITRLADENGRLNQDLYKLKAYILGERDGSGKSALEWINIARLAAAHLALTTTEDYSNSEAAGVLIKWRPAIGKLLKKNRRAASFTDKQRIIQHRKNFQSNRATKNKDALLAYRYARRAINRHKRNSDELAQLAQVLILAIDLSPVPA